MARSNPVRRTGRASQQPPGPSVSRTQASSSQAQASTSAGGSRSQPAAASTSRPQTSTPPRPQTSTPPRPQTSTPPRPQTSTPPRPQSSGPGTIQSSDPGTIQSSSTSEHVLSGTSPPPLSATFGPAPLTAVRIPSMSSLPSVLSDRAEILFDSQSEDQSEIDVEGDILEALSHDDNSDNADQDGNSNVGPLGAGDTAENINLPATEEPESEESTSGSSSFRSATSSEDSDKEMEIQERAIDDRIIKFLQNRHRRWYQGILINLGNVPVFTFATIIFLITIYLVTYSNFPTPSQLAEAGYPRSTLGIVYYCLNWIQEMILSCMGYFYRLMLN